LAEYVIEFATTADRSNPMAGSMRRLPPQPRPDLGGVAEILAGKSGDVRKPAAARPARGAFRRHSPDIIWWPSDSMRRT